MNLKSVGAKPFDEPTPPLPGRAEAVKDDVQARYGAVAVPADVYSRRAADALPEALNILANTDADAACWSMDADRFPTGRSFIEFDALRDK